MEPLTNAELSRRVALIKELSELVDAYGRENERLKAENKKLEAKIDELHWQHIHEWFAEGESYGHDSREEGTYG